MRVVARDPGGYQPLSRVYDCLALVRQDPQIVVELRQAF
jgi:hypothetical protein